MPTSTPTETPTSTPTETPTPTATPIGVVSFCPTDDSRVGYLRTDALGIGQGSAKSGSRTRKLVVPQYQDVDSLYGQLAAVDIGVMKYVRFLYPGKQPHIQFKDPTSTAFKVGAVSWWGSELNPSQFIKGQFFWGTKGNKAPRAFVLWPTYNTTDERANVFMTFSNSHTNIAYWNEAQGWTAEQVQTLALPATQAAGADIQVKVALVDNDKDDRPIVLIVSVPGGPSIEVVSKGPNRKDTLNIEEILLENVPAGTNEVTLYLFSPGPNNSRYSTGKLGGDSAAMIGAAADYACGDSVITSVRTDTLTIRDLLERIILPLQDALDGTFSKWTMIVPNRK